MTTETNWQYQWSDANARATGCNSTLQAALSAALLVPKDKGVGYTGQEYLATWACRFSDIPSVAKAAKKLWPTLNSYGYYPSYGFAIFALVAFGISALWHVYQLARSRRWAYLSVIAGSAIELTGWAFRQGAAVNVMNNYIGQLATLTIGPTFFAGGVYALFYAFASTQDRHFMPLLGPKAFSWSIFVIEIITIAIQAAGGVLAAGDGGEAQFRTGTRIMTAGTALQLATSCLFTAFFLIYYRRLSQEIHRPFSLHDHVGQIFWGVVLMELLFIIRGSYRTAELSEGLFGSVATNQTALILLDAIPMMLVSYLLNAVHPYRTVPKDVPAPVRTRRNGSAGSSTGSDAEMKDFSYA